MPTIELSCPDKTEHGMHSWKPEGDRLLRTYCPGYHPKPRDSEDWPLARRPRWVRQDQFWGKGYADSCRYCTQPGGQHQPVQCPLCGSVQCQRGSNCSVCYHGFMPGYRPGNAGLCGYVGCGRVAVAKAPRIGQVCKGCVPRVKVLWQRQRIPMDVYVDLRLTARDSGRNPERWRLVA